MRKVIILLTIILTAGLICALELPPEPMAFYGSVTYTNGTAIPNGYYLTAKIGTTISGECEIINSDYGKNSNTCIVINPSGEHIVEFYLGDEKLGEHAFQSKEIINLDFTVDSLPTNFTPLSNDICEPEKGECSYNILDCDASKTDICAGNGVCDIAIGETCKFTPQDCGACPECGDGICNNNETCSTCPADCGSCSSGGNSGGGRGGGSGGGGGGSTKTTTTTTTTTDTSSSGNNNKNESIDLNSTESQQTTNPSITGAVIGFVKSGVGIGVIAGLVFVLAGIGVVAKIKKKSPKNEK